MPEQKNNNKKLLLLILLLLLFIIITFIFVFRKSNSTAEKSQPIAQTGGQNISSENEIIEEEKLVLNFKSTQVVVKGAPARTKDFVNIFRYVYLGMGGAEDDFVARETSVDLKGSYSYKASKDKDRIFAAVGKSTSGSPIKQAMEILSTEDFGQTSKDCVSSAFKLNGVNATSIKCMDNPNLSCYIPIDDKYGLLYSQYCEDSAVSDNMCENLSKNGVKSIELQSY